jgi:hypothetical protein
LPVIKKRYISKALQIVGIAGTAICVGLFIAEPSFPTPDKLLIFLMFVFMILHQAKEMLKRLLPFVAGILVYESFRGLAHQLNTHVDYSFAPHVDRLLFGQLPTVTLQNWLWHGHAQWFDYALYIPYMTFFVVPIALALVVWKTKDHYYWQAVTSYMTLLFMAFVTFFLFPAAPPWMASDNGYIEHVHRISTDVWYGLGIRDFPSVYHHIAPNPVAAVPSLHAAFAVLFSILVFKLYGRRWGAVSLIYPLSNIFGIIYEGEHYAFDAILGTAYAFAAYFAAPHILKLIERSWTRLKNSSNTKNALESIRRSTGTSSSKSRRGSAKRN